MDDDKMRSKLRRPDCQTLINHLAVQLLLNDIQFKIDHIKGKDNVAADALSRYFTNPLQAASFPVNKQLNTTKYLQLASNLAAHTYVRRKDLKWEDEDDMIGSL